MRLFFTGILLLLSMQGIADAQQRFLRNLSNDQADVYLVIAQDSLDASDLSSTLIQTMTEKIQAHYSASVNLYILQDESWPEKIRQQAKKHCRKSYVLLLLVDGQSISELRQVLESLAELGMAITVLSAYNDEEWQRRAIFLGSEQPWILLDDSEQFIQRLYRWLQHVYYGRNKQAMPASLQSLTIAHGKALLSYSKASTGERWWSDILLFDSDGQATLDSQGQAALALDGSLQRAVDEYPSLSKQLKQQAKPALWVDNGIGLEAFDALLSNQWLSYFQLSPAMKQQLQDYYADDSLLRLIEHLLASLRGHDIDQQALPYPLAGIQHSKPLLIDYGAQQFQTEQWQSKTNSYKAIIVATNDGSLHSIDTSLADNAGTDSLLQRRYLIKPSAVLKQQADRMWNTGYTRHKATMDAELSAVVFDQWKLVGNKQGHMDGTDSAWLYISLGRGGKAVYRYRISDAFAPAVAGHINKQSGGDFTALGFSFAKPVGFVSQWGNKAKASLLLSAGYDAAYDAEHKTAASIAASEGNAIFLIDAKTAGLIWKAGQGEKEQAGNQLYQHPAMLHAIASKPTVLAAKYPYLSHSAYVGDVGGQLWHIHLPACKGAQCEDTRYREKHWSVKRLAVFAENDTEHDRRFFHSPAVWQSKKQPFIAIASGNRELPLEKKTRNYLFLLRQPDKGLLTTTDLPLLSTCLNAGCSTDKGWKMPLALGEKPLSSPVYYQGYLYLSTYQSHREQCRWAEDSYRLYRIALSDDNDVKSLETLELPSSSVFRLIDANNIALLAAKIEDYLQQLDDADENNDDGQSQSSAVLKSQGIVIHSWREKNN